MGLRQREPKSTNGGPPSPAASSSNGAAADPRHRMNGASSGALATDRSHLLRRTPRSAYFDHAEDTGGIRLRRERRLNAPFSAIPTLARRR